MIITQNLLTRKDVARLLNVAPQTLAVWASRRKNELQTVKLGRLVRYRPEDVANFIATKRSVETGVKEVK